MVGLQQVACVTALLISFVAMIALVNGIVGGLGGLIGFDGLTVQSILGYLLAPLAFVMGVPWSEATQAASFIGQKIVINEFVAYIDYVKVAAELSPKTQAIVTFALCGFANIGSVAMVVGGLGGLVPGRRKEMNTLAMKTLLASVLANLMSGTIAGLLVGLGS